MVLGLPWQRIWKRARMHVRGRKRRRVELPDWVLLRTHQKQLHKGCGAGCWRLPGPRPVALGRQAGRRRGYRRKSAWPSSLLRIVFEGWPVFLILLIAAAALLTGSKTKAMETPPSVSLDSDGNPVALPALASSLRASPAMQLLGNLEAAQAGAVECAGDWYSGPGTLPNGNPVQSWAPSGNVCPGAPCSSSVPRVAWRMEANGPHAVQLNCTDGRWVEVSGRRCTVDSRRRYHVWPNQDNAAPFAFCERETPIATFGEWRLVD